MHFIDETTLDVEAGAGGDGIVAFRREKFVPRGGPSGGNGGKGGDVIFVGDRGKNTLFELHIQKRMKAERGQHGGTNNKTGRSGKNMLLRVPVGTLIYDKESGELKGDIVSHGQQIIVAQGGSGGLGNSCFATPTRQAPDFALPGRPGEAASLRLTLKLLADVAIIGYPSVGKSTLISKISQARPKIAEYPFTTLIPNLGVVKWKNERSFIVADIPGLIEGAHEGHGLGDRFLRHIERTRMFIHIIEVDPYGHFDEREPIRDYQNIQKELEAFNPELLTRPQIVVLNKMDLPASQEAHEEIAEVFLNKGIPFMAISAATHKGLKELIDGTGKILFNLGLWKEII